MKRVLGVLSILLLLSISGCASKHDKEMIYEKSAFITKLVRKVQVGIKKDIHSSEELYGFVSQRFPKIMKNFDGYTLKFKSDNKQAVVLMCDEKGEIALVEDISCSAAVDANQLYEKNLPCEFSLDVKETCSIVK